MTDLATVSRGSETGAVYRHDIPAERPWSRVLKRGQTLRIVDSEGQQAVDALLYSADDPAERYSAQDTLRVQGSAYVGLGTKLISNKGRAMAHIAADTALPENAVPKAKNFLKIPRSSILPGAPALYRVLSVRLRRAAADVISRRNRSAQNPPYGGTPNLHPTIDLGFADTCAMLFPQHEWRRLRDGPAFCRSAGRGPSQPEHSCLLLRRSA